MANNAGIHASVHFFRNQYGSGNNITNYYDLLFGNNSKLAGLTAVGDRNMLGWIKNVKALVPGMHVLGRLTPHETIKAGWGDGDPVLKAKQWAAAVDADLQQSPEDAATRYIYWQPIDETLGNYTWHRAFDIAAMNEMKGFGRRYAALNLYTGCPHQPPYDDINDYDTLWPMIQEAARLGPEWVTLQTHAYIDTNQELTFAKQQYHALRPFYLLDRARRENLNIQLMIGETGTLAGWPYSGLTDYNRYADALAWMWNQYQKYPEVKTINTYTCDTAGNDGENWWFVAPEIVQRTRDYNEEHYDDTAPVPPPEPPPGGDIQQVNTVMDGYNSNIRSSPDTSTSANIVTTLAQGAKLGVGALIGGWYEAYLNSYKIGVIRSDRVAWG